MNDVEPEKEWPRTCPECGAELETAVVDFDKTNPDRPELRPGEMVAVDFCPNPECPSHRPDLAAGAGADTPTGPGSQGGDNGGA